MENYIKELYLMKAIKCLGMEESHHIQYKNEKDKLKKIKIDFERRAEYKK
jgi:hypothetical protein